MSRNVDRLVTFACAGSLAVLSSIALAGWIFHLTLLTRISRTFAPTQFSTALCFLLYSAGLLVTSRRRRWFLGVPVTFICTVGLLTLLESLLGHNFGIDTAFGYYIVSAIGAAPSRMADATAAALICIAASLWSCGGDGRLSRFGTALIATLGSIPLAVAVGALLGFCVGVQGLAGWTGFTQIGIPTVVMCTIAGAYLLWVAWRRSEGDETWLPIPIFFGLLALTLTLAQELQEDQTADFNTRIQSSAQQFVARAHAGLYDMFAAFDRMAHRWDIAGGTAQGVWISDARSYLHDFKGVVALERVDAQGKVRWAVPPLANPSMFETRLRTEPLRAGPAKAAKRVGVPQVTRITRLGNSGTGFLYINPLHNSGADDGLQIGVVRVSDLLAGIFTQSDINRYAISVVADGVLVYSSSKAPTPASEWTRSVVLTERHRHWVLSVTPSAAFVSGALSSLPQVILGAGSLISALISLSIFLVLKWRGNMRSLREKEEALERSDARYEVAVKGSGVGLWDFNVVSGELYWSSRYREILGIEDPAFLPGRTEFESRVHPDDCLHVFAEISHAIARGISYDGEARLRRDDGSYVWLRLRGIPTRDAHGKFVRLSGSVDDISALKRAEDALRASEETFRITMDSAPVGIALMSPDKRLLRANRAMARLVGCSHERELSTLEPRTVLPTAFDEDRAQMDRLIAGEIDRYEFEHELLTRDGKVIWVLTSASLARDPDGSPRHIVKQLLDISGRKEMERMKSEFISIVSHELRTPLTAIRGSLGLMATAMSATLPEKVLRLVQIANRNCERLIALVNDILDMEKLAANRMAFKPQVEDAGGLTRQALEANTAYADRYGVGFVLAAQDGSTVLVDPDRFAQVLANLLSNAVKFSPEGSKVKVSVRQREDSVRIEVRDYGAGIPDEFRPRIFGRFMQADSSISRAKGGTGLGLHISRQLVERMGGTIGFQSVVGEGSVFWIAFPFHVAELPAQARPVS